MCQRQFGTELGEFVSQPVFRIRAILRSTSKRGGQSIPDQDLYFGQSPVPLVGQALDKLCDPRVLGTVERPVTQSRSIRGYRGYR